MRVQDRQPTARLLRWPNDRGCGVKEGGGRRHEWPVMGQKRALPRFPSRSGIPVQVGPGKAPHAPLWPVLRAPPPADGVSGRTGHNGHRLCLVTGCVCERLPTSANVY